MTDIVERLRIQSKKGLSHLPDDWEYVSWGEAADEIDRLRLAIQNAKECLDADDTIGAYEILNEVEDE